jgi:hypothetical protein
MAKRTLFGLFAAAIVNAFALDPIILLPISPAMGS